MDVSSLFKFFLTAYTSFKESKYKDVVVLMAIIACTWASIVYAAKAKPSSQDTLENRVASVETNQAIISAQFSGINSALQRIETSEIENRKDLSELKNVLIAKGR